MALNNLTILSPDKQKLREFIESTMPCRKYLYKFFKLKKVTPNLHEKERAPLMVSI
jgi:hypothetical protein